MRSLRVAFVGAGWIAHQHLSALRQQASVEVAGVADMDAARAAAFAAAAGGCSSFGDCRELIQRARPDVLYICLPPHQHGEVEGLALDHDIPFFVEKPLPPDLSVAEDIAARVAKARLPTGVGYQWRHMETLAPVREWLRTKPPSLIIGHWLDTAPPVQWWYDRRLSGGQLVEQATHLIDLCRVLGGEIAAVAAAEAEAGSSGGPPGNSVGQASAVSIRFRSGAVGSLTSTWLLPRRDQIDIDVISHGQRISINEDRVVLDAADHREERSVGESAFVLQAGAFLASVRSGSRFPVDYAEALRSHRVALAATAAARAGGWVEVPDG